ncbi:SWIM zinc finger family protein [Rhodococcus sp. NPDC003348]
MSGRGVPRRPAGSGWGRSLLGAIERAAPGARLSRGRSHVRAGQVLGVRLAPGLVIGEVQGSQNEPFTATFTLRRLDPDALTELVDRVRGTAGVLAAVASGVVPAELGELLLPIGPGDVDFGCTCPDQGWPCRHAAALVAVTAERLDSDPTLLLTLRGVDLDTLIRGVDERSEEAPDLGDWFGDDAVLPALPRLPFAPAPQDLNPVHLRAALRATAAEGDDVARALRDLDALYRALGGE